MARITNLSLLSHDRGEQLSALRALKNEIIGHSQRKEKWIENGVLEPVVKVLSISRSAITINGKDSRSRVPSSKPLTGEETVRLQALQILASLANGTIIPARMFLLIFANFHDQVGLRFLPQSMRLAHCLSYYRTYLRPTTLRKLLLLP